MADKDILSAEEAQKMDFRYVTGTCKNCGGNQFHFDPEKQTFVCEYCSTEVYAATPKKETPKIELKKPVKVEVKKVEEDKTDSDSDYKPSVSSSSSSSYSSSSRSYGSGRMASGIAKVLFGIVLVALPMIARSLGVFEAPSDADELQKMICQVMPMALIAVRICGVMNVVMGMLDMVKSLMMY